MTMGELSTIITPDEERARNLPSIRRARQALEKAVSVDEVAGIRDKMEALRVYGAQIHDRELESHAAEIRIRAERRFEELTRELRKAGKLPGPKGGGRITAEQKQTREKVHHTRGGRVSQKGRTHANALADASEAEVDAAIEAQKAEGRVPTTEETVNRLPNKRRRQAPPEERKRQAADKWARQAVIKLRSVIEILPDNKREAQTALVHASREPRESLHREARAALRAIERIIEVIES